MLTGSQRSYRISTARLPRMIIFSTFLQENLMSLSSALLCITDVAFFPFFFKQTEGLCNSASSKFIGAPIAFVHFLLFCQISVILMILYTFHN